MPVQSAYETYHDVAVPGQKVSLTVVNIESYAAETTAIPFGRAVVAGTGDDQCKLPAVGGKFIGVSEYTSAGTYTSAGDHEYPVNGEVNVIDFGKVWVTAEVTVARMDKVYYRAVATGSQVLGAFSNVLDTDNILIPGAYWATSATAGKLAQIFVTVLGPLA